MIFSFENYFVFKMPQRKRVLLTVGPEGSPCAVEVRTRHNYLIGFLNVTIWTGGMERTPMESWELFPTV